ncbi:hypothetical protein F5X98DRAFT_387608 [Xylaria grammica]|nr:hypothetical protein F5X98DRAFT_387608 [Xylaria grammica]
MPQTHPQSHVMGDIRNMPTVSVPPIPELDYQSTTYDGSSPSQSPHSPSTSQRATETSVSASTLIPSIAARSPAWTPGQLEQIGNDPPRKEGWPRLAQMLAESPKFESFRRFRELNVKTLLYYQAEIAELEKDLMEAENNDTRNKSSKKWEGSYAEYAHRMIQSQDDPNADKKQCDIVLKIRERVREYNRALLQHAEISMLPLPDNSNVEILRVWIKRGGCGRDRIGGEGATAWGDTTDPESVPIPPWRRILPILGRLLWPRTDHPKNPDLVRIQPLPKLDRFTRWMEQEFVPLWHDLCHPEKINSPANPRYNVVTTYSELKMLRFTSFVATVIACVLPTVAIGILTTAKTTLQKLYYIGGFTALFAIGLLWLAESGTTRVQVFMATAAFSAVLVVFVQNQ